MVITTSANRFPVCYDCQKAELHGEIMDPAMKALFDIPEELYRKNAFLRDIKINYLKFGNLTDKQIEAFKKTVQRLQSSTEEVNEK